MNHVGSAYTVTLTVPSENGFGALLRGAWSCEMRADGDRWLSQSVAQVG